VTHVLDSSAFLAFLWSEPGGTRVAEAFRTSIISTVNVAEIATRLVDRHAGDEAVQDAMKALASRAVPFDLPQARTAGLLRRMTRPFGLSLGDRACLALALAEGAPVLTADRAWASIDVGVRIELIR
jgi:PIN domain nuclease of toxin-antitoxin system